MASYFFAVSLSFSIISAPTRHALFRFKSCSFSSFIDGLPSSEDCSDQNECADNEVGVGEVEGEEACADSVLWSPEPGFGGMRRYEGKK